jgi:hypothetical protein
MPVKSLPEIPEYVKYSEPIFNVPDDVKPAVLSTVNVVAEAEKLPPMLIASEAPYDIEVSSGVAPIALVFVNVPVHNPSSSVAVTFVSPKLTAFPATASSLSKLVTNRVLLDPVVAVSPSKLTVPSFMS